MATMGNNFNPSQKKAFPREKLPPFSNIWKGVCRVGYGFLSTMISVCVGILVTLVSGLVKTTDMISIEWFCVIMGSVSLIMGCQGLFCLSAELNQAEELYKRIARIDKTGKAEWLFGYSFPRVKGALTRSFIYILSAITSLLVLYIYKRTSEWL